ncbi:hypothetical protein [Agrobacterium sp. CG674]
MGLKLTNNAVSTLASSITSAATAVSIQGADAGKFPVFAVGDWCPATIIDSANNMEIVRVTARAGAALTIVRAQEGTTAKAFAAGSRIDVRLTAGAIGNMTEQNASSVAITGGTIQGIADIAIADGGTGGSTAAAARANLGANNASNLDAGTIADARLPATMLGKTFTTDVAVEKILSVGRTVVGVATLEIGGTSGAANPAVIDFHTSATPVDYNVRLLADGNSAVGAGNFNILSSVLQHNGDAIWDAGNLAPISQAEARAGVGTINRAWTAQRVAEAAIAATGKPTYGALITASTAAININSGIPSDAKRITLVSELSSSASLHPLIQLGTGGALETTGYVGVIGSTGAGGVGTINLSTSFMLVAGVAVGPFYGVITLTRQDPSSNKWIATSSISYGNQGLSYVAGSKTLAGPLDRIQIGSVAGTVPYSGTLGIIIERF